MLRLAFLALMICAIGYGDPRESDVYAIYSLMLTHPKTSHGPDTNELYLIAAVTAPTRPQEPCVAPPKERLADFREVLADYKERQATPRKLKRAFSISTPYLLLDATEVAAFMRERMVRPGGSEPVPEERFKGATDLFTLSDIYFNRKQTLALTAISTWCGSLCGRMEWKVFEKLDKGEWRPLPWIVCTTMS